MADEEKIEQTTTRSVAMEAMIRRIKLPLTGGVLKLEISDDVIGEAIAMALERVQRYMDVPTFVTVNYSTCIDLSTFDPKVSTVTNIYRTSSFMSATDPRANGLAIDPMYSQWWAALSGGFGTSYNYNNAMMNLASWTTMLQIRNTISTDLQFDVDQYHEKLYISCAYDFPPKITIEYVPIYDSLESIHSEYWLNIIEKYASALVKVTIGNLRTYATQTNAIWSVAGSGETLLQQGTQEIADLETDLKNNVSLIYLRD